VIGKTVDTPSDRFASADIDIHVAPIKPTPTTPVVDTDAAWS
jgi:hypothetical protein